MRSKFPLFAGLALVAAAALAATHSPPAKHGERADIRVKGLGWVQDRRLRQTLILLLGGERGATLGASAIEDAALIVFSSLNDQGYLQAGVSAEVARPDGTTDTFTLDPRLQKLLPRSLVAKTVIFHVRRGRRFILAKIDFDGLTALRPDQARTYFRGEGWLDSLTADQAYSPVRLQRSTSNFTQELEDRGYAQVRVRVADVRIDFPHARVAVRISVSQGPLWRVRRVRYQVAGGGAAPAGLNEDLGQPWNTDWQHAMQKAIYAWYYKHGFPDTAVHLTPEAAAPVAAERAVTVVADVSPGSEVHLGRIRFSGSGHIRQSVLRRLVRAKPGAPLDPSQLEDGQVRVSRLGAFRSVDLRYDPPQGAVRDAIYQLREGKKQDVNLMLGWGSFEELRGGVEWRDYNLFHTGSEGTLKLTQSVKSSEAEYDYVMPELFGTSADGTAKFFGFDRHDRSFLDKEYGATLSAVIPLSRLGADLTAGYTFVRLNVGNDTLGTYLTDLTHANATSVQVTLTRDRRDNPLLPRHGYKIALQLAEAATWLGGQVDFQEAQFNGSYHTPWGHSRWIHAGFNYSVISPFGATIGSQLPPNVLFYPGGEDSVRGYGFGQAAPRDANGNLVGARSMALLNLELEQALTSKWSLVAFSDSLATPGQRLYSVGLGIRLQTFVGPVRLEYGRNINRRIGDPRGTLQFSVGFPF